MKIISWNVNSVRARIENIKHYIKDSEPDVLMLQEIKTQNENFPNDEFMSALFTLEKFLFDNYSFIEEVPIKIIKQKWIYESIEKDDYTNNITKTFEVFKDLKLKNKIFITCIFDRGK